MITLTNPIDILAVLGGAAKVNYESVELISLSIDHADVSVGGVLELRSPTAKRPPIQGSLRILTKSDPSVTVSFSALGFFKKLGLNAVQITTISNILKTLKDDVEGGLVSFGLVDGVQS